MIFLQILLLILFLPIILPIIYAIIYVCIALPFYFLLQLREFGVIAAILLGLYLFK